MALQSIGEMAWRRMKSYGIKKYKMKELARVNGLMGIHLLHLILKIIRLFTLKKMHYARQGDWA